MGLIVGPEKGQSEELRISPEAHHRIVVGLSWDPKEENSKIWALKNLINSISYAVTKQRIMEKLDMPERDAHYTLFDLDLYCFAYDQKGMLKAQIDVTAWNTIDESGKIYHSGEDMDGMGGPDDEQVHIEFKNLPDDYNDFFFVVESDSRHNLSAVSNAQIRIADSMTEKNQLHVDITKLPENKEFAFVFCRLHKNDGRWMLQNLSDFTDFQENWSDYLKNKYLTLG